MPKHRKILGTGITAKPQTLYSGQDMGPAIVRMLSNWSALMEKGGGQYGGITYEAVEFCRAHLAEIGKGPHKRDSQAWFSQQILIFHSVVKKAIEAGDADEAARFAYEMGYLHSQAHMKGRWEPDALRGEKVAGGERNAAHSTNVQHEDLRAKRFARMGELVPTLGVDKAAIQCELDGLGGHAAIKRQWNRFRRPAKKGDT